MSLAELNNSLDGGSSNKMSASGFFNHIFNFDNDNKSTIMNMLQYIILGLIPVVLVLKTIVGVIIFVAINGSIYKN